MWETALVRGTVRKDESLNTIINLITIKKDCLGHCSLKTFPLNAFTLKRVCVLFDADVVI